MWGWFGLFINLSQYFIIDYKSSFPISSPHEAAKCPINIMQAVTKILKQEWASPGKSNQLPPNISRHVQSNNVSTHCFVWQLNISHMLMTSLDETFEPQSVSRKMRDPCNLSVITHELNTHSIPFHLRIIREKHLHLRIVSNYTILHLSISPDLMSKEQSHTQKALPTP